MSSGTDTFLQSNPRMFSGFLCIQAVPRSVDPCVPLVWLLPWSSSHNADCCSSRLNHIVHVTAWCRQGKTVFTLSQKQHKPWKAASLGNLEAMFGTQMMHWPWLNPNQTDQSSISRHFLSRRESLCWFVIQWKNVSSVFAEEIWITHGRGRLFVNSGRKNPWKSLQCTSMYSALNQDSFGEN